MADRIPLTEIAQQAWEDAVKQGDWVIDATCGNGHDTAFLARAIAPGGRVFAFDVQDSAIRATTRLLKREALLDRVTLIKADHSRMREPLSCSATARFSLICFNLGYLPTGDHALTTRPETTIPALQEALTLLKPGGHLSVMAYRGHDGAMRETEAVHGFMGSLPDPWTVLRYEMTGTDSNPGPVWWWVGGKRNVH